MFLRPHHRDKDGKRHTYWSLVETIRTADGPRQRTLCHLGELNDSAQARWLRTIEVFNEAGDRHQLKLFPAEVAPPPDDAEVAQVLVQRVRLERTRHLGPALLGLAIWRAIGSASSSGMAPAAIRSASVGPSTSSMTSACPSSRP